jgi:hypothetical protein
MRLSASVNATTKKVEARRTGFDFFFSSDFSARHRRGRKQKGAAER